MNAIQILMYHQIGRFSNMSEHRATYCDYRRFKHQMAYLAYFRYRVLALDEALVYVRNKQSPPPRAVVLTFDDAYENFYEYALPVLQTYGFAATVYAISGMVGSTASWLGEHGHKTPPLMGAARLREIRSAGIMVGSHSVNHVHLTELERDRLYDEVFHSKAQLEDVLGEPVSHFCYPYGSHNAAVVQMVRDAGYASAVTCVRGAAYNGEDPHQLPRKAISYGDSLLGYAWKLHAKNRRKHPVL